MAGRLTAWTAERATASGLSAVAHGALVEIDGAGPALVTALLADRVELAPLSPHPPRLGAEVRVLGPLAVPAGEELIGRAIDGLGRPLDGGGAPACVRVEPVFGRDPVVVPPAWRRLTLGALVYDLQRVIAVGASLVAVGPEEVWLHVLRHQAAAGRVIVFATPAGTVPAHLGLRRGARPARAGMPAQEPVRCIHVAAERDATPAQQWLVPWTAMAIASSLRAQGRDVVVAIESLDAWQLHARAFPARGSWATQLAQLTARAYARPSGSVSLLARAREVSPACASAFDEILDLSLAVRGELPVIGTKLVRPPLRVASPGLLGQACVLAALLAEHQRIGRAYPSPARGTGPDLELEHARRLRECLRFRTGGTLDSLEQLLGLLAVTTLPDLAVSAVAGFVDAYLARLRRDHAGTLAAIRAAGRLDADDERALLAVAAAVAATFR
ncbi:MAG TPA: hypothetical protein VNO30_42820 [Kofleriaceae bacterium]|nr:hypothetical protein [Kofleriaceae bacterium]